VANRRVDSLKAKQKRQKIVAAGLGVVFIGVLAFQGPRLWKQLHPATTQARPSYNETSTTSGTPTLAAPTLGGSQTPGSSSSTDSSLAASSAPPVADGQLSSFSLFASKDPFAQQLSDRAPTSSSGSSAGGSTGRSSGSSRGGSESSSSSSSSSPSPSSASGGRASAPTPGTAVISVNGTLYSVAVGNNFPEASTTDPSIQPLFHLVSVTAHSAKVSIVGGSYASGAATVTLRENKPVTLMNTADGTRYKLILKPVGTPVAAPAAPASATSTTVTVPPPSSP
jgi:hypothetical protein